MAPSLKRSSRKDANVLPSASSTFWAVMILVGLLIAYCSQLAAGTCEIVTLDRDSSQPRRTIARQTARCACKKGQIAGTTRARPACVDDNHPVTLFKVSCLFLGKEEIEVHLKGRAEEFADFLEDKIAQLHSQLDAGVVADPVEAPEAGSCPVIWEQFDPPEEVNRILG
ncbi:protein FAM19A5, partial [Pseudonaja textilis]|uniref:protein FAM19A5 n=1 Tax=Pseudonaja textilis TaxID=8673 RepID=UPI000EAA4744